MENKILRKDQDINLYLVANDDKIIILNDRISHKSAKNYKYWQYLDNKEFHLLLDDEDTPKQVIGEVLVFNKNKDLNEDNYNFVYDLILDAMRSSKTNYIVDILNMIERYFRTIYSALTKDELQGMFSEFLFLKYMQENGFDIQDSYHKSDKYNLDFYFRGSKKYGEIKSSINDTYDYKIAYKQASYDPKNTFLITVNLWPDENGINFLELLKLINFTNPDLIEKVDHYKESFENDLFIKEQRYNINKYEIKFYKSDELPQISFNQEYSNNIKNIIYDISTIGLNSISLKKFIELIK